MKRKGESWHIVDGKIPDDLRAAMAEYEEATQRIVTRRTSRGQPMLPPWQECPDIPYGSIGWRMGYGEDYKTAFNAWFVSLTREAQSQYQSLYPEPETWSGYLAKIADRTA